MFSSILALLGLVPGLLGPISTMVTKWRDSKVQVFQAQTGHGADVAIAAIQAQEAVNVKWQWTNIPPFIIGLSIAMYVFKVVAIDVVIGSLFGCYGVTAPGTCTFFITDPLSETFRWVFISVVTGYFGTAITNTILKLKG